MKLLAIAWSLRCLTNYLIGIKFVIITDWQSLVSLNAWKTQNPQIARLISEISEFKFEIQHRKRERMFHVDALSRAPIENESSTKSGEILTINTKEDELLMFQRSDSKANELIEILRKPESTRTKTEKGRVKYFILFEGLLFKRVETEKGQKDLYYVPNKMRKSIAIRYHDLYNHFGVDKTLSRISEHYYFSYMRRYLKVHIRSCIECIISKGKSGRQEGELHPIPPEKKPFDVVDCGFD